MHPCPCAHCLPAAQAAKLPHSLPWSASVLDFATPSQARQCIWPYRVHHFLNYGLVVRFQLLSTPPLDDAVAFSYGQPVLCPTGTFTLLLVRTFRRTSPGLQAWEPTPAGMRPKGAPHVARPSKIISKGGDRNTFGCPCRANWHFFSPRPEGLGYSVRPLRGHRIGR